MSETLLPHTPKTARSTGTNQRRERPILFSGEMVRAILAGRKTQTRRIVKPQPTQTFHTPRLAEVEGGKLAFKSSTGVHDQWRGYPYGVAGDRLWVRETWAKPGEVGDYTEYRADNPDPLGAKWRPSIHMPRWASRITLEITKVRVERLQDISEEDAKAEGGPATLCALCNHPESEHKEFAGFQRHLFSPSNRLWYVSLWDSINGKGSWDANPWVWVLEFRVACPSDMTNTNGNSVEAGSLTKPEPQ